MWRKFIVTFSRIRDIWEDYIEQAEDIRHSPQGKESYCLRSQTIERVFADAKEKYGMRYTPYRGLKRVSMWVRLKYAAMNLKKLAMWKWKAAHRQFFVAMSIAALKKNLCCAAA